MFGPIVAASGPIPSRILFLGDHPEETHLFPGGYELRRMCDIVGLNLNDTFRTNVFSRQPNGNNLHLYGTDDPQRTLKHLGPFAHNPTTHMDLAHEGELARLYAEIEECSPNVIVALGNTASWALGLGTGIKAIRGSVHTFATAQRYVKILPTYHPSVILRDWSQRVVALSDLEKAVVESATPEVSFDNSELWLNPDLEDLAEFDRLHMAQAAQCACDIETKRGQITAISFAPRPDISLAIPLWLEGENPNYWHTPHDEAVAWSYIRRWMERDTLTKVFQNGLYDLQYLMAYCTPRACTEDTMLQHHSLFSELQKGLGFLGSVYANVPSWKSMRTFARDERLKRDD